MKTKSKKQKPTHRVTSFSFPIDLADRLAVRSAVTGVKKTKLLEFAVTEYLAKTAA